jgi:hypothetical protein
VAALLFAQDRAAQASPAEAASADRALARAIAELDAARAELRRRSPRAARLFSAEPVGVAEVQRSLADGDLLLEYHLAQPRSFLFVIGRRHFDLKPLPSNEQLSSLVRLFVDLAASGADDPALPRVGRRTIGRSGEQERDGPADERD